MMVENPDEFRILVHESLRRQIAAIDCLTSAGLRFWDYGNAFLLEASRAGANIRDPSDTTGTRFKYPSYMQDVLGDIFSLGFGPFRWICASGCDDDLVATDKAAAECFEEILQQTNRK
jgi:urocanate hydratase